MVYGLPVQFSFPAGQTDQSEILGGIMADDSCDRKMAQCLEEIVNSTYEHHVRLKNEVKNGHSRVYLVPGAKHKSRYF